MMTHSHKPQAHVGECPEDLSVLARRGELSAPARRRLELCLQSSEALRAFHELGQSFDEIPDSLPSDQALLKRLAVHAVRRFAPDATLPIVVRPRQRRRRFVWFGAAAIWFGACVAGATLWPQVASRLSALASRTTPTTDSLPNEAEHGSGPTSKRETPISPLRQSEMPQGIALSPTQQSGVIRERPGAGSRETPPDTRTSDAQTRGLGVTSRERTQIPPSGAANPESVAAPRSNGVGAVATALPPNASATMASAHELFSAANHARQAGDLDEACKLYRTLQERFPRSNEAILAHLLLGRLELGRGNASPSLLEYERYLQASPNGALAQEALQGKARALHQLGRRAEERRAWTELLQRFPRSAYTEVAEEHLSEGP